LGILTVKDITVDVQITKIAKEKGFGTKSQWGEWKKDPVPRVHKALDI
jgi:hypothetical protein